MPSESHTRPSVRERAQVTWQRVQGLWPWLWEHGGGEPSRYHCRTTWTCPPSSWSWMETDTPVASLYHAKRLVLHQTWLTFKTIVCQMPPVWEKSLNPAVSLRPGTKLLSHNWNIFFFMTILYHFQTFKLFPVLLKILGLLVGRSNAVLKCTYFKINCPLTPANEPGGEAFYPQHKLFF